MVDNTMVGARPTTHRWVTELTMTLQASRQEPRAGPCSPFTA